MLTAVITGANSGIGHEWAKLLVEEGYNVHALDVSAAGPIEALESVNCTTHVVDVTSPAAVGAFAERLEHAPVHLLLHVAGVLPASGDGLEAAIDGSKQPATLDSLTHTFQVNAAGPLLLTQALLPNLMAAVKLASAPPVRVAIVSAHLGSMALNTSGGFYAYRSSKAAVNAIGRSLSADLRARGILVALLDPGSVRTNMSRPIAKKEDWDAAADPVVAAAGLWEVLTQHFRTADDSGRFWSRQGHEIPW